MGKLLFWAVIIIGILLAARILARQAHKKAVSPPVRQAGPLPRQARTPQASEPMVRCAHCGIHLPRSEAVLMHGHTWCSPEHARLGVREHP